MKIKSNWPVTNCSVSFEKHNLNYLSGRYTWNEIWSLGSPFQLEYTRLFTLLGHFLLTAELSYVNTVSPLTIGPSSGCHHLGMQSTSVLHVNWCDFSRRFHDLLIILNIDTHSSELYLSVNFTCEVLLQNMNFPRFQSFTSLKHFVLKSIVWLFGPF